MKNIDKNFYSKVTSNKKSFFIFVLIISFIAILPSFDNHIYIDCDLTFHLHRIEEIAQNLSNGIVLPAIESKNIFGLGYLVDIFYPNLFLYIPAIIFLITKNIVFSFSMFLFMYNIFTFFICYHCIKLKKDKKMAFYFAILYLLFPYRLMNLYLNGFVGEFLACTFLPLVVFGTERLFKEGKYKELTIGMIGVLYCHTISLLLCSIYILIYCIFNTKNICKNFSIILNLIKTSILAILVGFGFLLPFIDNISNSSYKYNTNSDISGILSYGLFNLPILIEITIQLVLIFILIIIYKKKKTSDDIFLYSLVCTYGFLMLTKIFPWELAESIPFLRNIQFSLRIIPFILVFAIYIMADLCYKIKEMDKVLLLLCISFIPFTLTAKMQLVNNEQFEYKNSDGTYLDIVGGEYLPSSFSLDEENSYLLDIYFPAKESIISYSFNKDNKLTYILELKTKENIDVSIPLIYYKNYNIYKDNELIPKYENNGLLYLKNISSGTYYIKYQVSNIQIFSCIISIVSLCFLIFIFKKELDN